MVFGKQPVDQKASGTETLCINHTVKIFEGSSDLLLQQIVKRSR